MFMWMRKIFKYIEIYLNKIVWSKLYEILQELFDKKTVFLITIFDKVLAPFWKRFLKVK